VGNRYACIRYETATGWRAGSGLIVTDRAVLTADHVADGSHYYVEYADGWRRVREVIRSGTLSVDLAVLVLEEPISGLTAMPCARVGREAGKVTGCVAVGYPKWRERSDPHHPDRYKPGSAQVEGYILTADGLLTRTKGGTDGQLLTLIGEQLPPGAPRFPEKDNPWSLVPAHDAPWGGMSGAAVMAHGMVIGVVRSWRLDNETQLLGVTPLTALKLLPTEKYEQFCAVIGVRDIDDLVALDTGTAAGPTAAPFFVQARPTVAFSDDIRNMYRRDLIEAGLAVPDRWDYPALYQLSRGIAEHAAGSCLVPGLLERADDTLEALCAAVTALQVLLSIGAGSPNVAKLRDLYHRHIGPWPRAGSLEGLLIEAASAGIEERRRSMSDNGFTRTALSPLAKFALAIARQSAATLDDPKLAGLADWVTGTLGHQREDAASYLATKVRRRAWAVIEFDADDTEVRKWPRAIVVDVTGEDGDWPPPKRFDCREASQSALEEALRAAVTGLPDGEVFVDLCLPRKWLDAGVEHLPVVKVGDRWEGLSRRHEPRLRWARHRNDPSLRPDFEDRFAGMNWQADPKEIPVEVLEDKAELEYWLDDLNALDVAERPYPPYFTGSTSGTAGHDPLAELLRAGYACMVWFGEGTSAEVPKDAVAAAVGLPAHARREGLPRHLARGLWRKRPIIIWNDPDGRAGFPPPPTRLVGTLRTPQPSGTIRKGA
jgi:hypothetical protein